jgi:hypothetical protein
LSCRRGWVENLACIRGWALDLWYLSGRGLLNNSKGDEHLSSGVTPGGLFKKIPLDKCLAKMDYKIDF